MNEKKIRKRRKERGNSLRKSRISGTLKPEEGRGNCRGEATIKVFSGYRKGEKKNRANWKKAFR